VLRNYESPFLDHATYPRRRLELPAVVDLEAEDLYSSSPFSSEDQERYDDYEEEDSFGYVDTESVVSAREHASLELLDAEDIDDVDVELIELDNELRDELDEESEDEGEDFEEDFAVSLDNDIYDDEFEDGDECELESYLDDESDGEEWEEVDEIENNESKEVRYEDEHNHQTYDLDETEDQNSYDDEADEYDFESDSTSPVHIESQIKRRHEPRRPDRFRGSAFEIESDYEYDFDVNEIAIADKEDEIGHDESGEEIDEEIVNELFAYDVEREGYPSSYHGEVDLDSEGELHESLFIEPIEGDDVFDEDLEWLSEEVKLVESYIPSSKLSWSDASREQLQFMQKVYRAVVARSSKKRSFIPSLPEGEISEIENIELQKDAASALEKLLQAARQKINGLKKNVKIKIASGYRSADKQFRLWEKKFPDYYKRTQIARSKLSGGDHGTKSVNYMAGFIRGRLAAPGYSLHQSGVAVDFQPTENGKRFIISTKSAHRKNWRNTWFWNWLTNNAATYKFYQNNNIDEPWHWEYRGNNGAKPKLPVKSVGTDDISAWDSIIEKAKDTAASGKSLYIAMSLISKGERDENKITNTVFYAQHPSKEKKLKRHDPLIKDWLNIRSNIVRPLLSALKKTRKNKVDATVLKPGKNIANVNGSTISKQHKIRKYQKYYTMHPESGTLTKDREGMHRKPEVPRGLGDRSGVTLGVGIDLTTLVRKKSGKRGRLELASAIAANSNVLGKWIMDVPNNIRGVTARRWLKDHPMPGGGFTSVQLNQLYRFGRQIFDQRAKLRLLGKTGYRIADANPPMTLAAYNDLALDPTSPRDDYLLEFLADLAWNSAHFARGKQNKIAQALTAENVKGDRYEKQIAQLGNLRNFIERGKFGGNEGRWRRLGWIDAKITQLRVDRSVR
jgi:LAS superfamily LD-carboxypeptidase LdcB